MSTVTLDIGGGAVTIAGYDYNGAGHLVGTDYPAIEVMSLQYGSTSGAYPDLDRFDRVTSSRWTKDLATDRDLYDLDITYDRNSNILRVEDHVHDGFDVAYTMDDLNRLTVADQGTWSGSAITSTTRTEDWTLDQVGNWDAYDLDEDGDATLELNETRGHTLANELTSRNINSTGPAEFEPEYDGAGHLVDDTEDYAYVWDAFGRLRQVKETGTGDLVAEYTYNGLGYRIGWHYDANTDGDVDGSDPWYRFVYDERWRIVATYRAGDADPKEQFVHHAAGDSGYGTASYIDDVILRDRDDNSGWTSSADGTVEERVFQCQNWRHDVVALVDGNGAQMEMVRYSPYGVAFGLTRDEFQVVQRVALQQTCCNCVPPGEAGPLHCGSRKVVFFEVFDAEETVAIIGSQVRLRYPCDGFSSAICGEGTRGNWDFRGTARLYAFGITTLPRALQGFTRGLKIPFPLSDMPCTGTPSCAAGGITGIDLPVSIGEPIWWNHEMHRAPPLASGHRSASMQWNCCGGRSGTKTTCGRNAL